jgi:hypothetical protein
MSTTPRAKRPRPGAPPLEFEKPKVSNAEDNERLVRALGVDDPDFLGTFINQVAAVGELGRPSDDHETSFLLSAIEDIVGGQSKGGVAKAMLAAQYAAMHGAIMSVARRFSRQTDLACQDVIGRLLSSLARTSVAQFEALNRIHGDVNVGHVSVTDGGQAILGNVTHNQQQETAHKSTPPQALLEDAKTVPMPILEETKERDAVAITRTEKSGD